MRRSIYLILACLLLLSFSACQKAAQLDEEKIAARIAAALARQESTSKKTVLTQAKQTESTTTTATSAPEPTTVETSSSQPDLEDWAGLLAGWWVDMDTYGEPADYPELYYFSADGYVFIRPEDLSSYEDYQLEPDYFYNWTVEDGVAYLLDYADFAGEDPLRCELEIDQDGSMFIFWPNGTFRYLEAATSAWASRILLASSYYDLAEDVQLGLIRQGSSGESSDGVATVFIKDIIMVDSQDTELIDYYDLHDAPFDNDYEIVIEDEKYYPHFVILENDFTIFKLLDYSDDYFFEAKSATYSEFKQLLEQAGEDGRLFSYCLDPENMHLSVIREIYLP